VRWIIALPLFLFALLLAPFVLLIAIARSVLSPHDAAKEYRQ
jgi:hypothetical protein